MVPLMAKSAAAGMPADLIREARSAEFQKERYGLSSAVSIILYAARR